MRAIRAIVVCLLTFSIIYFLDNSIGSLPPLGKLLDPMNGCWVNAEPVNKNFSFKDEITSHFDEDSITFNTIKVWYDDRMVPHVHTTNDHDLYFIQGFIHVYFRLWQMDMQTRAAAGRVSEVVGDKALVFDRTQRRKGMVFAAENSLRVMEADPRTKKMLDAYTSGVNHYIAYLRYRDYPLEYKLMGFKPEPWTNLKTALLMKYMADDLTGYTEDIALTYLRDMLTPEEFITFFPPSDPNSNPVIPKGTVFEPALQQMPTVPNGDIWAHFKPTDFEAEKKEDGKGSNNWAVSGNHTQSGAPILCNDPHLGLNLPSLWFEIQLSAPGINVYGVSLLGAPGVVIGFNENISWGLTNNYRDVKDFYAIKTVNGKNNSYWFDGKEIDFTKRIEEIRIKSKPPFIDTVNYTIHGPVMYDAHFKGPKGLSTPLAMCWMAHRGTNELLSLYLVNRAKNYIDFTDGIQYFECPAQNMIYADKEGNIAIWGQGQFINKWKDQGRFVMNGATSATLWGKDIRMDENPHCLNPMQGYIASANQCVTDSTYPYWYNGYFKEYRSWRINNVLRGADSSHLFTVQDMFALQNDEYSVLAQNSLPYMLNGLKGQMTEDEKKYADLLKSWDYKLSAESIAASVYQIWWELFYRDYWNQKLHNVPDNIKPTYEVTTRQLQNDTLSNDVKIKSFKEAVDSIVKLDKTVGSQWYQVKNTSIKHLTKLPAFSYPGLKIGGWGTVVNAVKSDHGPSWRMVVQMTKDIEAYGVYPGGQSGNPGSKYYGNSIQNWVEGKYYRLLFLPNSDKQNSDKIKYTWILNP